MFVQALQHGKCGFKITIHFLKYGLIIFQQIGKASVGSGKPFIDHVGSLRCPVLIDIGGCKLICNIRVDRTYGKIAFQCLPGVLRISSVIVNRSDAKIEIRLARCHLGQLLDLIVIRRYQLHIFHFTHGFGGILHRMKKILIHGTVVLLFDLLVNGHGILITALTQITGSKIHACIQIHIFCEPLFLFQAPAEGRLRGCIISLFKGCQTFLTQFLLVGESVHQEDGKEQPEDQRDHKIQQDQLTHSFFVSFFVSVDHIKILYNYNDHRFSSS